MQQIFAPWRIEWVERDGDDGADCVFCDLAAGTDDRENRVLARGDHAFALLNNYPYNPGHAMVVPYEHEAGLDSLSDEILLGHARLKRRLLVALRRAFSPDGFNVGLNLGEHAGGSIRDHLHTHVVPRWGGDTNFMPVIGDTKVIVQALEDTYDRLHEALAEQEGAVHLGSGRAVRFEE